MAGSNSGRIFLAANDCNLYEFEYTNEESSWKNWFGVGPEFSCKKRKYQLGGGIYGFFSLPGGDEDVLVDLAVDDVRKLLYAVSRQGKISVFHLPPDRQPEKICTEDIKRAALNSVSFRGSVRSLLIYLRNIFVSFFCFTRFIFKIIIFPSRYIFFKFTGFPCTLRTNCSTSFCYLGVGISDQEVQSVHVITAEESSKMSGVVVLLSGIRIYFHVMNGSRDYNPRDAVIGIRPSGIVVKHVRYFTDEIGRLEGRERVSLDTGGYEPLPSADHTRRRVSRALYSNGSFFCALEKGDSNILVNAKMEWATEGEDLNYVPKENLCALRSSRSDEIVSGRVEDIKEVSRYLLHPTSSKLHRLFHASGEERGAVGSRVSDPTEMEPVPGPSQVLPFLGREQGLGYTDQDLPLLGSHIDLCGQMVPTEGRSAREFLCLTNRALHVITQRRPIDYLYALLQRPEITTDTNPNLRRLFDYYGVKQSAAMCVAIACDIPRDISCSKDPLAGIFCNRSVNHFTHELSLDSIYLFLLIKYRWNCYN